jgi:DNA helicase-2/ATP-dependent DNA helicase PcrA
LQKTIWTDREDKHKIKLLKCMTDDEEGRRVADLILEQKHRYHLPNSDIAILYRTNSQSRKFEEHLRRLNMAYRVFGGLSFYQRKEVKDFVGYLRLAVNPNDEEALRRIINYPTRGISSATVDKISQYAGQHNISMWDAMIFVDATTRARKAIADFRKLVENWQRQAQTENAYRFATDILRQSRLLDVLKNDTSPEGIGRLENVNAVLDAISEFTDGNAGAELFDENDDSAERSIAAYLQTISLLTDADQATDEQDYITLMSAHAAKGLEFRSIFVTGLEENLFPSFMALEDPNGLDEERRLFYVAITRAKEFLTISYAQNRYRYGQFRTSEPSRFLEEINTEHFELLGGIGSGRPAPQVVSNPRASIQGNFSKPRGRAQNRTAVSVPADFKPSPPEAIVAGSNVLHLKFGSGQVKSVEGPQGNKVATIQFQGDELPERRIVLRFAKLQVM